MSKPTATETQIKLNAHHVTDGIRKVPATYSSYERRDGQKVAVVYAKEYGSELSTIFPNEYENNSDIQTDYFEKGRAVFPESHPLYAAVVAREAANRQAWQERRERLRTNLPKLQVERRDNGIIEVVSRGITYYIKRRAGHADAFQVYTDRARFLVTYCDGLKEVEAKFRNLRGIAAILNA